ncbi:MAG: glycerophosphodiester phosphodiesterase [Desulfobacterales bacterium]|jgi:glycerophosphoryl diester phosphodiesterase|nr:glycerophosphodiester phosphodiesterase [Desulfobacterales bacterium]
MSLFDRLENLLLPAVDRIYARVPQSNPGAVQLKNCRIVAHRGAHERRGVLENTLPAFDAALAQGVWGIEFDIRWTRDLVPVVIHDPGLQRVFGLPHAVSRCRLEELAAVCPRVPRLADVIHRYGGKLHLMAEIKAEPYPDPRRQAQILRELLSGLAPGEDFHLLALDPELFRRAPFVPPHACLPVARLNPAGASRLAARAGYAGVAGHYQLVGGGIIRQQHALGRKVGTGYAGSRSVLLRELRRGVDWIFTNHVARLQAILKQIQP